jgi:hypothetical protein
MGAEPVYLRHNPVDDRLIAAVRPLAPIDSPHRREAMGHRF